SADLSPLHFDPSAGLLTIRGNGSGDAVREAISPAGFLEVTIADRQHLSDPASALFDPALAGASRETLAGIRVEAGSGHVPLALAPQTIARGLTVRTDGPVDVTGAVQAQGPVAITAGTITVHAHLQGTTVDLNSAGLVNVAAKGSVAAGRIGVTAGVL